MRTIKVRDRSKSLPDSFLKHGFKSVALHSSSKEALLVIAGQDSIIRSTCISSSSTLKYQENNMVDDECTPMTFSFDTHNATWYNEVADSMPNIRMLTISPSGRLIASCDSKNRIWIHSLQLGKTIAQLGVDEASLTSALVTAITFLTNPTNAVPNLEKMLVAYADLRVQLFNINIPSVNHDISTLPAHINPAAISNSWRQELKTSLGLARDCILGITPKPDPSDGRSAYLWGRNFLCSINTDASLNKKSKSTNKSAGTTLIGENISPDNNDNGENDDVEESKEDELRNDNQLAVTDADVEMTTKVPAAEEEKKETDTKRAISRLSVVKRYENIFGFFPLANNEFVVIEKPKWLILENESPSFYIKKHGT